MKNIHRFCKSSSFTPSVKRFSSSSGMLSLSEYTDPDNTKTFSETDGPSNDLEAKVDELTAKVDKLAELVSNLSTSGSSNAPEVKSGSAEESNDSDYSYQDNDDDTAATGNENTDEDAKGAEVPGNTGTYTQVPEDEIVSQFSSKRSNSSVAIPSLGNKDTFNVLFK